jgi:hypothetical protein
MLALTIVTAALGFAFGAYTTFRYGPTLDKRPGSVAVGLIVCALVGAAFALAFMYVYLAVHAFATADNIDAGFARGSESFGGSSPDASIFVNAVFSIASESGVLLALAAGVFLLAPSHAGATD